MGGKKQNRLAFEKSPYLRQHGENPVDWYPWGPEAFEKAQRENKPIFLSIGYSTCHWCHVMAHESFENPLVAQVMNEVLVSIKVDREERPDIDLFYMAVCQKLTGSGGWPLSIIMTPDKQPFFAGTYIPRETRFGRLGMLELIPRIKEIWATRQAEVLNSAKQITATLQPASQPMPGGQEPGEPWLHLAFRELSQHFDSEYGGFGNAPKFPTPHNLLFLLRYWKRTGNRGALEMVEKTLQKMRSGGVYDQIGFGFHRYSTDRFWLVPHFEKMLYDQALMATACLEAYQATRKQEYARTAREIFAYVLRDMTAQGGGFYSAEDADSEGEEGKFYLWSLKEIKQVLKAEESDLGVKIFNVHEKGNFTPEPAGENNKSNILHMSGSIEEIANSCGMSVPELQERLNSIADQLFAYRNQRAHPSKDDKVLTDWNGLMIAALAKGARILNEPRYAEAARRAIDFIAGNMLDREGRLLHRYRDGEAAIPAHIDDYAFLIYGLVEMYETTFVTSYLKQALLLNAFLIEHFWDERNGGFYFTADDSEQLPIRQKEIYDGAIPSGNSVATLNLLRLGRITANPELEMRAAQIGRAFSAVRESPSSHTQLLVAIDFAVGPSYEVVIAGGSKAKDTEEMLFAINQEFIPNKVVVMVPAEIDSPEITLIAPYTRQQKSISGRATAYVCVNYNCQLPATDIGTMRQLLNSG
jgi:uncharacterized protein YyaL (SSP411 family)